MRNASCPSLVAIAIASLFMSQSSTAAFTMELEGTTTVTVEVAAIRSGWDDDPIIYAVNQGDELVVHSAGGHGNGSWLQVTVKSNDKVQGHIDIRQTSFDKDFDSKKVQQPLHIRQQIEQRNKNNKR